VKKKILLKNPRRCAICGKTGHNTRTCPLHFSEKKNIEAKKEKTEILFKKNTKETKILNKDNAKFINVKISADKNITEVSPYIVNLNKKDKKNILGNIIPYREEVVKKPILKTLVFSDLIKQHKIGTQKNIDSKIIEKQKNNIKKEPKIKVDILAEIAKIENKYQTIPRPVLKKQKKFFIKKPNFDFSFDFIENLFKPKKIKLNFSFDFLWNWKKTALASICLFVLVAIPYPSFSFYKKVEYDTSRVTDKSVDAFLSLQSSTVAVLNSNVDQAKYDLAEALKYFGGAEEIIDNEYNSLLYVAKLIPVVGQKIKTRQNLLEAGHKIALGNAYLVKAINDIQANPNLTLLEKIEIAKNHINFAEPIYEEAWKKISDIDTTNIPVEYQETFFDFKNIYEAFVKDIASMSKASSALSTALGSNGFRRYLILFQNQNEIRASGGFVGSYAVVDLQNGKILNIDIPGGGSYDLQGQLKEYVLPPLALQTVNQRWEFQDGNWFVNFPDTAKKMEWFYKNSRNSTVDGVIAINASVLERVLKVLGPVENKEFDLILDSNNALKDLQYEIENYEGIENKPKAVLSEVFNQMFSSLNKIEARQMFNLIFNIHEALTEKEIQFYFKDNDLQNLFSSYNWTGEVKNVGEKQDYLLVTNNNVGGGKSDFNIEQTIEHQALVQEDGSVIDTVVITRKHNGQAEEYLFGDTNVDYLKLYVPEGSELLEAGGFIYPDEETFQIAPDWYKNDEDLLAIETNKKIDENNGTVITNEYGKTVFANWIITAPGEEKKIYFIYKLPFTVFDDAYKIDEKLANFLGDGKVSKYNIIFQKQSGINSFLSNTVIYPDSWSPVWSSDENCFISQNGAKMETVLKTDGFYGIVMQNKN